MAQDIKKKHSSLAYIYSRPSLFKIFFLQLFKAFENIATLFERGLGLKGSTWHFLKGSPYLGYIIVSKFYLFNRNKINWDLYNPLVLIMEPCQFWPVSQNFTVFHFIQGWHLCLDTWKLHSLFYFTLPFKRYCSTQKGLMI